MIIKLKLWAMHASFQAPNRVSGVSVSNLLSLFFDKKSDLEKHKPKNPKPF